MCVSGMNLTCGSSVSKDLWRHAYNPDLFLFRRTKETRNETHNSTTGASKRFLQEDQSLVK